MNTFLSKVAEALDAIAAMPVKAPVEQVKVASVDKDAISTFFKEKVGSELPASVFENPEVVEALSKVAKQEIPAPPTPMGGPSETWSGIEVPQTKEAAAKAAWDSFEECILNASEE